MYLVCLVPLHYTFYGTTMICLFVKRDICGSFMGLTHYASDGGMSVVTSDCSASIPRNIVTPLVPLSTHCDLPL